MQVYQSPEGTLTLIQPVTEKVSKFLQVRPQKSLEFQEIMKSAIARRFKKLARYPEDKAASIFKWYAMGLGAEPLVVDYLTNTIAVKDYEAKEMAEKYHFGESGTEDEKPKKRRFRRG